MPSRKMEDLHAMELEELRARLNDAEEELANQQFQLGSGQLENTASVKESRKNVARIKTLIRDRELKADAAAGGEA
ncbi:50S ribosomal protein L29 [bacterium]|nr:50S ribosomal protein L29 [bacterium]